ncbi:hypothetical protein SLEP1_g17570 [Rubroshorea leprosula]|uniref:Ycf15 n=1 Tax=Rubroshorea leprosula TaxID=152421 RepID=A0AAV5IUP1_9ROSI|nr:hypothetical protein SLEP1_g17570 [Rubroshorea leprosula]
MCFHVDIISMGAFHGHSILIYVSKSCIRFPQEDQVPATS